MPKLTIVAHIKAASEKVDFVKSELQKLIDVTRSEDGCVQYDLHQDNENPAHFMFYENWGVAGALAAAHGQPAPQGVPGGHGRLSGVVHPARDDAPGVRRSA